MKNESFNFKYFETRAQPRNQSARELQYSFEKKRISAFFRNGKILDYGAGLGEFTQLFLDSSSEVYVYDISEYARFQLNKKGFNVIQDLDTCKSSFDLVLLRGVLQHLPDPFNQLIYIRSLLKSGGLLVLLATPNCRSVSFLITGTNPSLSPSLSYLYPTDVNIINFLQANGFRLLKKYYPYWKSPYRSFIKDNLRFMFSIIGFKKSYPYYRNMMELYFEKL